MYKGPIGCKSISDPEIAWAAIWGELNLERETSRGGWTFQVEMSYEYSGVRYSDTGNLLPLYQTSHSVLTTRANRVIAITRDSRRVMVCESFIYYVRGVRALESKVSAGEARHLECAHGFTCWDIPPALANLSAFYQAHAILGKLGMPPSATWR
jgi:hypothetical protein